MFSGKISALIGSSKEIAGLNKKKKNYYYDKCKNHFNEMKGDVGMSLHEKEGNKKNLHQADNPFLYLCFKKWFALFGIGSERQDLLRNNCMLSVQEQRNKK